MAWCRKWCDCVFITTFVFEFSRSSLKYLSTIIKDFWTVFLRDCHVRNITIYIHFFWLAELIPYVNGHRFFHNLHRFVPVFCLKVYLPFLVMDRIKCRRRKNFKAMTPICGHVSNLRKETRVNVIYIFIFIVIFNSLIQLI